MTYRFRRPELAPTIFMLVVVALLFKLGFWQLDRLQWKTALIANIEKAQSEAPKDLLSYFYIPGQLAGAEWHNVRVTGRLLNEKELYATPRYYKEQMGYAILTPLEVFEGNSVAGSIFTGPLYVLVNRGWVPPAKKDPTTRASGNPQQLVTVEGVIRSNVERGALWRWFFPNHPEKNLWLTYDIPAMAQHTGLPMLPVLIDATRTRLANGAALKDGPTPFPLEINIRNDHFGYAITWFLIGICGIVIFGLYYVERRE